MSKTPEEIAARLRNAYSEVSAASREAAELGYEVVVHQVSAQEVGRRYSYPVFEVRLRQDVLV